MVVAVKEEIGNGEYRGVRITHGLTCHSGGVVGYGAANANVVFVGISPAKEELRLRRPFVGASGKLLDAILNVIGPKRNEVYCTNLVCHWMTEPNKIEADECANRLKLELLELKPKLIVLLGKFVTEYFTNKPFGKTRGAIQWNEEYNCYIMCSYHPAAIVRSIGEYGSSKDDKASKMIYDFVRDIKKISEVVRWEPGAPEAQVSYTIVRSAEQAQNVLDNLPRSYDFPIGLDVETNYDKESEEVEIWEDNKLLCVGVGTDNHCWVFMPSALYRETGESALDWTAPNIWWTMQNAIFDTQIMRRLLGVWIDVKEDAMLQSYSLDERAGIHGLKPNAREYLGASFYEDERGKGKKKLSELDDETLALYNARDVCYTVRLCLKWRPLQIEDEVRGFYDCLLIPAINMFKEIQFRGVNIDLALHAEFTRVWGQTWLDTEQELQEIAHNAGFEGEFNLASTQHKSKLLFGLLKLPVVKTTKKGNKSTDKEVIEALKGQHIFVDKYQDFSHLDHMWKLYIVGLRNQLKMDGRAHSIIGLHRTTTGRPAYTQPPLQTIPVPYQYQETFGRLRELFIASSIGWVQNWNADMGLPVPDKDDEMVVIEADYGKAEIWMAYNESQDPQLYADLTSGDYHTTVAMDVMKKARDEVSGQDRVNMKRVTFGIMYDREAPSLSKAIKTSVQTAQEYIDGFFRRNRFYAKWFRDIQTLIRKAGEIVTKTGRKRRIIILGSPVRALKQAVNFPIQSVANDMLLSAALLVHPKLKALGGHIMMTVHDSIVSETPRSRQEEAIYIIHDDMIRKHYDNVIQIPVEIKVGYSWGRCKAVHECGSTKCLVPTHEKGCGCRLDYYGRSQECLWKYVS